MAKISRAFREHLVHNILSNLINSGAYLRLSLYNTDSSLSVDENTKLNGLGTPLADITNFSSIGALTSAPAPTDNPNSDWDIKIAGKYYRLTATTNEIEQSDKYWDTLIAEFNTSNIDVDKYNTRALIYSENGEEIPILIEKFPVERELEKPTITCIVKF